MPNARGLRTDLNVPNFGTVGVHRLVIRKTGWLLLAGDCRGGGPPGSIPNPEVKPTSADDTASAGTWESRSSPAKSSWSVSIKNISVVI